MVSDTARGHLANLSTRGGHYVELADKDTKLAEKQYQT